MNEIPCPSCGYPMDEGAVECAHCTGTILTIQTAERVSAGRGFFLTDFLQGFFAPFRATLTLLNHKEFMGKLRWPVLANVVVFSLIFGLGVWGIYSGFSSLAGTDWGWAEDIREWTAGILAVVLTAVVTVFLAPTLIEVTTSPFLDGLATVTESTMIGSPQKPIEKGLMKDLIFGVRNAAKILVWQLLILIPAMLLSLIPGLFFLPLLVAAYLNALVWFEIPVMRRHYELRYRRWLIRRNWARSLGFGFGFQVGMFVPFFNILFLAPAAAVATSELYFRFEKVPGQR